MKLHFIIVVAVSIASAGCGQGDQTHNPTAAMREHADRVLVDNAVLEAINEPNGGDYARAVAIINASDRPQGVKDFQIGRLIVGSFRRPDSRRPEQTLQQGLSLLERAAIVSGESREVAHQQLRLIFERGVGTLPDGIPIDRVVADCWHKLENGEPGDPAACVALRRRRLPQLSP